MRPRGKPDPERLILNLRLKDLNRLIAHRHGGDAPTYMHRARMAGSDRYDLRRAAMASSGHAPPHEPPKPWTGWWTNHGDRLRTPGIRDWRKESRALLHPRLEQTICAISEPSAQTSPSL